MQKLLVPISFDKLPTLDREIQLNCMRKWFYENYEDPVEELPYDSEEGGYVWIWGGPYDAREELESQFGDYISEDVISELADQLENISPEWSPIQKDEIFEANFVRDIRTIADVHEEFIQAILNIQSLLTADVQEQVRAKYFSLLFANVITALESYLADKFIQNITGDADKLQKFVESTPHFKKENFSLAEIFKVQAELNDKAGKFLADQLWHNLARIKPMYKATLDVDFGEIGRIMQAVTKRHHIVHRNGRDKDGNPIDIDVTQIELIISDVQSLVSSVESQLKIPF